MTAMGPTVNICAIWDAELSSLRLADVFGFLKHCSVLEFYMADLNNWNLEIIVFWLLIDDETFQWVVDGDLFDITWHGLRVCEIHLNTCSLMYIAMFVHDLQLNSVYVKSMSTNLNWHKLTRGSFPWIAFVHHLCQDLQIKTSVSSNKTWICLRNPQSLYIPIHLYTIFPHRFPNAVENTHWKAVSLWSSKSRTKPSSPPFIWVWTGHHSIPIKWSCKVNYGGTTNPTVHMRIYALLLGGFTRMFLNF